MIGCRHSAVPNSPWLKGQMQRENWLNTQKLTIVLLAPLVSEPDRADATLNKLLRSSSKWILILLLKATYLLLRRAADKVNLAAGSNKECERDLRLWNKILLLAHSEEVDSVQGGRIGGPLNSNPENRHGNAIRKTIHAQLLERNIRKQKNQHHLVHWFKRPSYNRG